MNQNGTDSSNHNEDLETIIASAKGTGSENGDYATLNGFSDIILPWKSTTHGGSDRPIDDLPKGLKSAILSVNRALNVGRRTPVVIVTGSSYSGKSYLISQFADRLAQLPSIWSGRKIYKVDDAQVTPLLTNKQPDSIIQALMKIIPVNKSGTQSIIVTNNIKLANMITAIGMGISAVVELGKVDLQSSMTPETKGYAIVDADSMDMTWGETLSEAAYADVVEFAGIYDPLPVGMAEEICKDVFRLGYINNTPLPKKSDLSPVNVGLMVSILEKSHAALLDMPDLTLDKRGMKTLVKDAADNSAMEIDTAAFPMEVLGMGEVPDDVFDDDDVFAGLFDGIIPDEPDNRAPKPKKQKRMGWKDPSTLAERLSQRVVGQEDAIGTVSDVLRVASVGLGERDRPIASFIFQGPSGVGKTELAKVLAQELYEKPVPLIRLDMSEYSVEDMAVTKLIGSSSGFEGSKDGGVLTNKVMKNPQSIVLLDEAEKANDKMWNTFLQVFDEGRLTDGRGNLVDFSDTVIIMTTNLGNGEDLKSPSGFAPSDTKAYRRERRGKTFTKALRDKFSIEFLNRIDSVCLFDSLDRDGLVSIIDMQLEDLAHKLTSSWPGLCLDNTTTPETYDWFIGESDFDRYGAREMKRTIRRDLSLPLADLIRTMEKSGKVSNTASSNNGLYIISFKYDKKKDAVTFTVDGGGDPDGR